MKNKQYYILFHLRYVFQSEDELRKSHKPL
jgi:hypothetical protein